MTETQPATEKALPRIVLFGAGAADAVPREEFGNKAANLAKMAAMGVPVPPGFALGVSVCEEFQREKGRLPKDVPVLLGKGIQVLEQAAGLKFGDRRRPLLVSVRSGAPVSMPGLMDTVLDVGLNAQSIQGLVFMTGNPRFAWDSYRRLVQSFAVTVFGRRPETYRALLRQALAGEGVPEAAELDYTSLKQLAREYQRQFEQDTRRRFPEDPFEQLQLAAVAVLRSWKGPKVEAFRRMDMLKGVRGTAVTVQAMVFGNMGSRSGAGVAFTRDPSTGAAEPLVDFKPGAQGEDVVSGEAAGAPDWLRRMLPEVHQDLLRLLRKLERELGDMQDLEFTVQEGRLFILQSRAGKRAPLAALRIAVDLVNDGVLSKAEALSRLEGLDLGAITTSRVASGGRPLAVGTPASLGVATGRIALTAEKAVRLAKEGPVILVRETASPDDLPGLAASAGLLAARGARTSHAAVVARQLGKVCIVDCPELRLEPAGRKLELGGLQLEERHTITLDGNTGRIYDGSVEVVEERPAELLAAVEKWRNPPL